MGRCRGTLPKPVRLTLPDGDWIDVRQELTAGEFWDLQQDRTDRKSFARVLAYVVAWSFVGLDNEPIPYDPQAPDDERRTIVRALDVLTVLEISTALDKHEAAGNVALTAKKKTTPDKLGSLVTSTLPNAVTGPLSTSAA